MESHGRALQMEAKPGGAAASKNPKAIESFLSGVIVFHLTGRSLFIGTVV